MAPVKEKRKDIVSRLLSSAEFFEKLADAMPKEESYSRGLNHGYADALRFAAGEISRGSA